MDLIIGILLAGFLGVVPMAIYAVVITWFDRYEKEPLWLMLAVFAWGAVVAAGSAFILNTLFGISVFAVTGSETATNLGAAVISAPIVAMTSRRASTTAGFSEGGLATALLVTVVRTVGIAFLHASLTACTGLGFAGLRLGRSALRFAAPLAGYGAAVLLHSFHNLMASLGELFCLFGLALDWIGFLGLFAFILYLVWREGRVMRDHLREEVTLGVIAPQHYATACSLTGQFAARWGALAGGQWRRSGQFYDLLGELAFKKYQLARRGAHKEPNAPATIERLRIQIAGLGRSGV